MAIIDRAEHEIDLAAYVLTDWPVMQGLTRAADRGGNADARGHGCVVDCGVKDFKRGGRVLAFEHAFHDLSQIMADIFRPEIEFKRVQVRPGFLASLSSAQGQQRDRKRVQQQGGRAVRAC